jgi:hypothetical protein
MQPRIAVHCACRPPGRVEELESSPCSEKRSFFPLAAGRNRKAGVSGQYQSEKLIKKIKTPGTRQILRSQFADAQVSAAKLLATRIGLLSVTDSD